MAPPLRCLVVDDHRLVAQAVGGLLSELCALELVAVCNSVAEALAHIERQCPDLLILDVHLPGEHWQDAAMALKHHNPDARVVFLTAAGETFKPPMAFASMVLAVVPKAHAWSDLVAVVQSWQQSRLARSADQQPRDPLQVLSPREARVFGALGRGLLNKQIAQELGLSVATVETYRKAISTKLNLSGAELVRAAVLHRASAAGLASGLES
jgi:DNA-binding NarL/FixJ family response regulator